MRLANFIESINETTILIERDVLNAGELKKWVQEVSQRVDDPTGQTWLRSQLFQYLINRVEKPELVRQVQTPPKDAPPWLVQKLEMGSPVFVVQPNDAFVQQAQEVIDWVNNWTNEHPGSRMNFTWEQAVEASEEWHKELSKGAEYGEESPDDPGLVVVHQYEDGFRWVDVQNEECLKREGGRMGHCVGTYGSRVGKGEVKILSLRNPNNQPHVTVEVENPNVEYFRLASERKQGQMVLPYMDLHEQKSGTIDQIKGKQNRPPVPKYIPYVKHLIEAYNFEVGSMGKHDLEAIGYYYRKSDGKLSNLKQIADVVRKYNDGYKWVTVSVDTEQLDKLTQGFQGSIKLVDKNWVPVLSGRVYLEDATLSVINWSINDRTNQMAFKDHLLDLFNFTQFQPDLSNWSTAPFLYRSGIYAGKNGLSDDPEQASATSVNLEMDGLKVYGLYKFDERSYDTKIIPYIFKNKEFVGFIQINENKQLDKIFISPRRYSGSIKEVAKRAANKLNIQFANPWLFGVDDEGNEIDIVNNSEHVGKSKNGDYNYYMLKNNRLAVLNDDENVVAIVKVQEGSSAGKIDSFRFDPTHGKTDYGLLGYILIDLDKQDILPSQHKIEEDVQPYGWSPDRLGDFWFASGADWIRIKYKVTRSSEDGEEVLMNDEVLGRDIDESVTGSEYERMFIHTLILSTGHYEEREEMQYDEEYRYFEEIHEIEVVDPREAREMDYDVYRFEDVVEIYRNNVKN